MDEILCTYSGAGIKDSCQNLLVKERRRLVDRVPGDGLLDPAREAEQVVRLLVHHPLVLLQALDALQVGLHVAVIRELITVVATQETRVTDRNRAL